MMLMMIYLARELLAGSGRVWEPSPPVLIIVITTYYS
jgi:hypothetical protein